MTSHKKGNLYLIPSVIASDTIMNVINPQIVACISTLDYYLVENLRTARRFLSDIRKTLEDVKLPKTLEEIQFEELSKKTSSEEVVKYLEPVINGRDAGVISEAGCPGIADPGALAVHYAHQFGIRVIPLVGPSSILLALMASGFSGQSFVFHGYLPIESNDKIKALKKLETDALKLKQTQIFMETPYRNDKLFEDILHACKPETLLCIAKDITGENEFIATKAIKDWKNHRLSLHKIPTIFMIY